MKYETHFRNFISCFITLAFVFGASHVAARQSHYDSIVVFGASLSDTGNAFVLLSNPSAFGFDEICGLGTPQNVPPYGALDELFIPDGTYARGGHRVTNGANWVEQLARGNGLSGSIRPALGNESAEARNYAVGGARANDYPCRFNLLDQLDEYLSEFSISSPDTLFVFEFGGNDLRDIFAGESDPSAVASAFYNIEQAIVTLYQQGARNFLLTNVPNFGQTPAVRIIDAFHPGAAVVADFLATGFNGGLTSLVSGLGTALPDTRIQILDLYALFDDIIESPGDYGIDNTADPCVTPDVPPYACKNPDTYLFWDGLHPTKAVHKIMALEAAEILSNP